MKKVFAFAAFLGISAMMSIPAMAEDSEKISFEASADVVSSYIWRGQYCGGFSIQPTATLTFNNAGLSIGAWASAELFEAKQLGNMTEFDLSLVWAPSEKLSIGLTDYNFCNGSYWSNWNFSSEATHNLEATLSYDFGPLAVAWSTCLTGPDYNSKGKRAYSSYLGASVPFKLGDIECAGTVGVLPWEDAFTSQGANTGFNVCEISLTAKKEVKEIPVFSQIVFNPQSEATYFVVGISF